MSNAPTLSRSYSRKEAEKRNSLFLYHQKKELARIEEKLKDYYRKKELINRFPESSEDVPELEGIETLGAIDSAIVFFSRHKQGVEKWILKLSKYENSASIL